ncbi:DEAD/DEAH box helicase [Phenylobacterium sp.]|uniref:DEAD/DEAH box helicase n=1 Tax=Phenylobacterium sp. TaxID=1871053 RepID=UPI002FC61E71
MSLEALDWAQIGELRGSELKGEIFSVIQQAASELQERQTDDPLVLAVVPRLAALIEEHDELEGFKEIYSALARSLGLWNYIDKKTADVRDLIVAEAATVPSFGFALHREQVSALNVLLAGRNLILSAPTSFGKSLLVDALLLDGRFRRVAIVLPTIALLDEFRRRLSERFSEKFDVLMHHSEKSERENVIFLGTQERLINREDLGVLDLVVVDEFYKLDPARKDDRSLTLNAAVYKLLARSKQFFFLGPNIDGVQISDGSRWRFEFLRTRFSTVAVDTYDLRGEADKEAKLKLEAYRPDNWPALIFASSPDKANKLAKQLVSSSEKVGAGVALASWMATNYGAKWDLSEAVAAGVGVHHGRIPRALASRFVKMFNERKMPILICTSTLIEGVNTAAKSVLIYDKSIARSNYDFFTFSNIKGRAGRLGQHHVGRVYLFHAPPDQADVDVAAPLFGDLDDAPDEFVVHIEDEDTTEVISDRIEELAERVGLLPSELKRFSSLGIEDVAALRDATEIALRNRAPIQWRGRPSYDQIKAICDVLCSVRQAREFGVFTPSQLTMYVTQLRSSATMRGFFSWHSSSYRGEPTNIDNVFKFLRACEYSLPEYFAVIELFVNKLDGSADYALFLAELPRWFRAEALKILEEQGVPIQISERFIQRGDTVGTLAQRLMSLAAVLDQRLTPLERSWIQDARPS